MELLSKSSVPHYIWGNNCDGWILVETDGLSIKQERMPPGTTERLHYHERAEQFFFVLRGTAAMLIDAEQRQVNSQEGIRIPPGVRHCIANNTDADIEFLVVSRPSTREDRINLAP